ncbi:MAG TPA: HEAT repeat domain-containing protein [Aggregatilineales bacterium]|nr:hypothetical protein [Anaerolineales bacterium]HRE46405.1 HEAT repeat domain-containing protein [Aggregatilineales bacterium]
MPDLVELWTGRLSDPEIAVRREAIRQLEMLGDPAALGKLAVLFALDPDLETRRLAQLAGKAIYHAQERRMTETPASEEERRRAADILAKAQLKKGK